MTGTDTSEERFEVEPRLESIALIQDAIEDAAQGALDTRRLFQLNMSVEELVTNVVRHSGAADPVGVVIRKGPGHISVEIVDHGVAFDPFKQAPKPAIDAELDQRPVGGLGVHLVQVMLDKVEYRRESERNHVILTMNTQTGGTGT